jgi:hypothetical protein
MSEKVIELHETSGADAIVRVAIPVDEATKGYRLQIRIVPEPSPPVERDANGWPVGFFENTAGKWIGELERDPQGEYEERDPF